MTDNELLLALSDLFDKKLEPIEARLTNIELGIENDIGPRLQNIEVDLLKQVVREHSAKLEQVS